jgi:hypothetical protein
MFSLPQVENVIPFKMSEPEEARAMLLGAALPGVGPATAAALAEQFGSRIEGIMDSDDAVKHLSKTSGIGPKKASKIKTAWDATRGAHTKHLHSLPGAFKSLLLLSLTWQLLSMSMLYMGLRRLL